MAVILALCSLATPQGVSHAQLIMEHDGATAVRSFHGADPLAGKVTRSFQSDAEARAEFDRILAAVGLSYISDRIHLRASANTLNAEAGINAKGERFIFYNATFMQKLKERTAEHWSLVSVLAHELGHHVAFHTEVTGNDHKYELEADYFSGFVLRRLGASLDASHAAMKAISPKEATASHPELSERLQVITIGWTDGGSAGAPRGLKERAGPEPEIPAAAAPAPQPGVGQSDGLKEDMRALIDEMRKKRDGEGATANSKADDESKRERDLGGVWSSIEHTTSEAVLSAFIVRATGTIYADLARARLDEVRAKSAPPPASETPRAAAPAGPFGVAPPDAGAGSGGATSADLTAPQSCEQLWYQRNAIFRRFGYCFNSGKGLQTFGNSGCSRNQEETWQVMGESNRQLVNSIRALEAANGC